MNTTPTLLGSSASLEGIHRMIAEDYFKSKTDDFKLIETTRGRVQAWQIESTKRGILNEYRIIKKGTRYRFELL